MAVHHRNTASSLTQEPPARNRNPALTLSPFHKGWNLKHGAKARLCSVLSANNTRTSKNRK
jgi:hypothetical protein